jgi:dipeptidyl aminopeptidase/acylaminoacyl peptidase
LSALVLALAAGSVAFAAIAAPSQILYGSDWAGPFKILAIDPAGLRRPADVSIVRAPCPNLAQPCGFIDVTASPDGRRVAFGSQDLENVWIRTAYGTLRAVSQVRSLPTWSSDSRRLAYIGTDGLHTADADGFNDRLVDRGDDLSPSWGPPGRGLAFLRRDLATGIQTLLILRNGRVQVVAPLRTSCSTVSWSADGRFLACVEDHVSFFSVQLLNLKGRPVGKVLASDAQPVWSPTGSRVALGAGNFLNGLRLVDAETRRIRLLPTPDDAIAIAWAPDGRRLAYLSRAGPGSRRRTGDLRVLTLKGKLRTLVAADEVAGGTITTVRWTRSPGATAWPALPQQDGTLADGPVEWLATAGDRVAYIACGLPYVWTPSVTSSLLLPPPTTEQSDEFNRGCRTRADRQRAEGIAIGSRTALYDWCNCPMAYSTVQAVDLSTSTASEAGHGSGMPGTDRGYGTVLGDESLLVFSGWQATGIVRRASSDTRRFDASTASAARVR